MAVSLLLSCCFVAGASKKTARKQQESSKETARKQQERLGKALVSFPEKVTKPKDPADQLMAVYPQKNIVWNKSFPVCLQTGKFPFPATAYLHCLQPGFQSRRRHRLWRESSISPGPMTAVPAMRSQRILPS